VVVVYLVNDAAVLVSVLVDGWAVLVDVVLLERCGKAFAAAVAAIVGGAVNVTVGGGGVNARHAMTAAPGIAILDMARVVGNAAVL
jgi:hypothetical protein